MKTTEEEEGKLTYLDFYNILEIPKNVRGRKTKIGKYLKLVELYGFKEAKKHIEIDFQFGILSSRMKTYCHQQLDKLRSRLAYQNYDFEYYLKESLKLMLEGHEFKKSGELAEALEVDEDFVLYFVDWLKTQGMGHLFRLKLVE